MQKLSLTLLVGFVVFAGYLVISKMLGGGFINQLEVYVGGDKVLHLVLAFALSLLSMMSFSHRFSEWKILAILYFLMLILTTEENTSIIFAESLFWI